MKKELKFLLPALFFIAGCTHADSPKEPGKDYPVYGGNKAGNRYSPLDQVDAGNVRDLQVAWMYDTAEPIDTNDSKPRRAREIQCQPIVVNGVLYGTTPELKLFALKAGTGEQIWKFEPSERRLNVSRGVAYWKR